MLVSANHSGIKKQFILYKVFYISLCFILSTQMPNQLLLIIADADVCIAQNFQSGTYHTYI